MGVGVGMTVGVGVGVRITVGVCSGANVTIGVRVGDCVIVGVDAIEDPGIDMIVDTNVDVDEGVSNVGVAVAVDVCASLSPPPVVSLLPPTPASFFPLSMLLSSVS